METIKINVCGETCPVPLVETRKALRRAKTGDIIEIEGTHEASKKEIPMAVSAAGKIIRAIEEEEGRWKIIIEA